MTPYLLAVSEGVRAIQINLQIQQYACMVVVTVNEMLQFHIFCMTGSTGRHHCEQDSAWQVVDRDVINRMQHWYSHLLWTSRLTALV
jgi:hypothetical protein